MSKDGTTSKPNFLTKWWFWAIVIAIIAAMSVAVSQNKDNPSIAENTESTKAEAEETSVQEYSVGDIISVNNSKVAVASVERNYSTGNQYIVPKDGKEFVKVTVSLENTGDNSLAYNALYWKIEDANGAITSAAAPTYSLDDALGSGELVKGGKVSGSIVFEVPAGDSVKVHYQYSPLYSDKQLVIKI